MSGIGVGDLAGSLALRRHNAHLKSESQRLGMEATTGRVSDLSRHLKGDYRAAAGMQRSLTVLDAYKTATNEADSIATAMQSAVEKVQGMLSGMASSALAAATGQSETILSVTAHDSAERFKTAVGALNIQIAGRSIFSGAGTGTSLADGEEILDALKTAVAASGATTSDDLLAVVNGWFDDPAGFGAHYLGSSTPLAPFNLGSGDTVALEVTAEEPELRAALKSLALAAVAGDEVLIASDLARKSLMKEAGVAMLSADTGLAVLGGKIGTAQAHIEASETRNSSEALSLKVALSKLTEVDQYDAATLLEAADQQLNTLYEVTARLSKLSLADYL